MYSLDPQTFLNIGELLRDQSFSSESDQWRLAALRLLLERTFDALAEAVIVVDPRTRTILACNRAVQAIFGYAPEELPGQGTAVLHLDSSHYEQFGRELFSALDRDGRYEGIFQMRRKDGTTFPTENTATEIRDKNGNRVAIVTVVRDMTASQLATSQLRDSEERYRRIAEMANEGIWLIDLKARTQYVNERMAQILGCRVDEMKGKTVADFSFPEDIPQARARIHSNLEGKSEQFDTRFRRMDGTEVTVLASTSPLKNVKGEITGALGLFSDIGDRKRAERELELANSIIQNSDDAIISMTLDGIIQTWNEGARRLFGYPANEAVGKPVSLIYPPDHRDEFPEILGRLRRGEHIDHFETVRMRENGTRVDVSVTISPVKDKQGRFIGASKIVRDITERKRTEQTLTFLASATSALSSSLDYDSTLVTLARLGVPFLADWCIVYVRDDRGEIRRIAVEHKDPVELEMLTATLDEFPLNPDAATGVPRVLRTGNPEFYPYAAAEILAADAHDPAGFAARIEPLGVESWMCVPLAAGRGPLLGAISLVSAHSERHYSAADLSLAQELAARAALAIENARLYAEAQKAIRLRDEFMSIASHELKTPLTTLIGYTELLERGVRAGASGLDERERRALASVHQSSIRLNKLVTALLDISRIQEGHLHIDRVPVDLALLMRRLIDETGQELANHSLEYVGPESGVWIEGDELRLEQVLQNLLQNAIKYSYKGGPIKVCLVEEAGEAVLAIADSGIGIPQQDIPHLFDRFHRAGNAEKLHIAGMGIGLYVVREIVSLHGGEVTVVSEEGKGSTFTVTLPLLKQPSRQESSPA